MTCDIVFQIATGLPGATEPHTAALTRRAPIQVKRKSPSDVTTVPIPPRREEERENY